MIDIEALAVAVSDAHPVGENTEYTALADLERLAAGTPGTPDPKTQEMVGGEEPNWSHVVRDSQALLGHSKDLRAACILTRALLATDGLAGLGQGLQLVARLALDFWEGVYPQLDADDNNDPIERLNALAYLNSSTGLVANVRRTAIVESRSVGRFTCRDLDLATGRLPVPEDTSAPTLEQLAAAWQSGETLANAAKVEGVAAALKAIADLESTFRAQTGERPDLDGLKQTLRRLSDYYGSLAQADAAQAGDGSDAGAALEDGAEGSFDGQPAGASVPAAGMTRMGGLSSRGDAVRMLKQVADFLRRTEPSSPAPMFVDRAVKVLQMDFAAIVKELMPDARERIELLGGVSLDPPSE